MENDEKIMFVDSEKSFIASELEHMSKSLLKLIEAKSNQVDINSKKSKNIEKKVEADELKTVKKLKSLVYEWLERKETDTENLERLNQNYKSKLKLLVAPDKENFPIELIIENKEEIRITLGKNKDLNNKKKVVKSEISVSHKEMKEESKMKQLIKENELKEQQKIEKVSEIIAKIVDEIEFLKNVKINKPIREDYIVQHIVSVISQYMRDIQQADNVLKDKRSFKEISSSLVVESIISVKLARSQGLAHNIFSLDSISIRDKVTDDVLPVYDHFQSIFTVYESHNKKLPMSLLTMNQLGLAFFKLGFYDDAIDCYKKSLGFFKVNPGETDTVKLSEFEIEKEENMTVSDGCQMFCGLEPFEFRIQFNLAKAFSSAGYDEKALEVFELFFSGITTSDLSLITGEYKIVFSDVLRHAAICLVKNGQYQNAMICYDKALLVSDHSVIDIKIGRAKCYAHLKEHEKAYKLIEDILRSSDLDSYLKFVTLTIYLLQLSHIFQGKEFIEKMTETINELTTLMQNEKNLFKKIFGEKYFIIILLLIQIRVDLIFNKKLVLAMETNMESEFVKLQNELEVLEKNCDEITKKLSQGVVYDQVVKVFTDFALCFSSIATQSNFNTNNKSKMIEKARQFFAKTIEIVDPIEIVDRPNKIFPKSTIERFAETYNDSVFPLYFGNVEKGEEIIDCLIRILKVQEQYDVDKSNTFF